MTESTVGGNERLPRQKRGMRARTTVPRSAREPAPSPFHTIAELNQQASLILRRALPEVPIFITDQGFPTYVIFALDQTMAPRSRVSEWYRRRNAAAVASGDYVLPDIDSFPCHSSRELNQHTRRVLNDATEEMPVIITTHNKDTHLIFELNRQEYLRRMTKAMSN